VTALRDFAVLRAFEFFDTNRSGALSTRELRPALKQLGLQVTESEARQVMAKYDADHNGTLSLAEFGVLVTALQEFQQQHQQPAITFEAVRRAFESFDTNRSGVLSVRELRPALKQLGMEVTASEAIRVMAKYDADGGGTLDVYEFYRLVQALVEFQVAQTGHSTAGMSIARGLPPPVDGPWQLTTEHVARSKSAQGAVVTRSREDCWDAALGSLVMRSGKHRVDMTILKSQGNTGACMQLGVADASAAPFTGGTVGFYPYFGHVFTERDAFSGSVWGKKLMDGNLQGRAEGTKVELIIDMDQRILTFAITPPGLGSARIVEEAGVSLPAAVRPWVRLGHLGDSVALAESA